MDEKRRKTIAERAASTYHVLHPCFPCHYQRINVEWFDSNNGFSPDVVEFLCDWTDPPTTATKRCASHKDPYAKENKKNHDGFKRRKVKSNI